MLDGVNGGFSATHQGDVELYGGSLQASLGGNTVKGNVIARGADSPQVVPLLTSLISKPNPGAKLSITGELQLKATGQNYAALTLDSGITVSLGVEDVDLPGKKSSHINGLGLTGNTLNLYGTLNAAGKSKELPTLGSDDELRAGETGDLVVSGVTLNMRRNSQLHAPLMGLYASRVNIEHDFLIGGKTGGQRVSSLVLDGAKQTVNPGLVEKYSTLAMARGTTLNVHNKDNASGAILTSGAEGSAIYGNVAFDQGILNLKKDKLTVYTSLENLYSALPANAPLGNVSITERTVLQGYKGEDDDPDLNPYFLPNYSQLVTGTLTVKHSSDTDKPVTFGAAIQSNGEGTAFNLTVDRLDLQSSKTTLLGANPAIDKSALSTMTNLTITGGSDVNRDFLSSSTTPREFIISGIMVEADKDWNITALGSESSLSLDAGNARRGGTSKHTITVDALPMTPAFVVNQGTWTVGKLNVNAGRGEIGREDENNNYIGAVLHISEKNGLTLAADTVLHVAPGSTLDLTQVGPLVVDAANFKGMIALHGESGNSAKLVTSDLTASADIFGGTGGQMMMLSEFDSEPEPGSRPGGISFGSDDILNVQGKLTLTPGTGASGGMHRSSGTDIEIGAVATIFVKTMAALDGASKPTGLIVNSQEDNFGATLNLNISGAGKNVSFLDATSLAFDSNGTLNLQADGGTNGGGIFAGAVTQSDGTIHVQKGHWTLGSLTQQASATADGGFTHISGGSLTLGGLSNIEYDTGTNQGDPYVGVLVDGTGVLKGKSSIFGSLTGNVFTLKAGVKQILVNGSGSLELAWDGKPKLTPTHLKSIASSLMMTGGSGVVSHQGIEFDMTGSMNSDQALKGTVKLDEVKDTKTLFSGHSVGTAGTTSGNNTTLTTGGFGADSLVISSTTTATNATVTVDTNKSLTLTGVNGKALVEVKNADGTANVEASNNVTLAAGASVLNIGSAADSVGSGALKAVTVAGGALNVSNGNYQIGAIDMTSSTAGAMTVDAKATLETQSIVLTSTSGNGNTLAVQGDSSLKTKNLVAGAKDTITVGDAGTAGSFVAEATDLNGALVFTDPAWKDGQSIADASKMAVGGSDVTGKYVVGQNSWVTMGSTDLEWLPKVVTDAKMTWGKDQMTAALGIYAPQTLQASNGGIKVDGSLTSAASPAPTVNANEAIFANKSLLVVNALGIGSNAAITAVGGTGGLLTVDAGASLLLVDGKVDASYTIVSGFTNGGTKIDTGGWMDSQLVSSNLLQTLTLDTATAGTVKVNVGQKKAEEVLPEITPGWGGFLDDFINAGLNDPNSPNAGIAFISNALSSTNGLSAREVVSVVESAAQMALAGGAPSASLDAVTAVAGPVTQRTGIAMPMSSGSSSYAAGDSSYSFGVWGMPMFRSSEISNQKAGSFKYSVDNKLYGGIIGFDVTNPMMGGDFRLGAALNIGAGDSKSRGGLSKTKNKYDFWGASVYAGYRQESFGVSGDFGFTSTASDIKQNLPMSLGMGGQLSSKVDAQSYTVGLKAEYIFRTSAMDITPYIGMRYIGYRQAGFNVNSQRGTVFNMAKASMDTFTFPIGVKLSREFELSGGWNLTPELNLAIVPAAGDTKLSSKAKIPGVNVSPASMTGHVFDGLTGEVGLGLRVVKDNVSFGLNYDFQGGSHQRAHSVSGSLRYAF